MGHLILAGLYSDDTSSAIPLLENLGVEPFLLAKWVHLICAQRLVRRICPDCKSPEAIGLQVLIDVGFTPEEAKVVQTYKGRGCDNCSNTGYKGQVGLYEAMEITEELQELISSRVSTRELKRKAVEQGMVTLHRSGLIKVAAGLTSLEEVVVKVVL